MELDLSWGSVWWIFFTGFRVGKKRAVDNWTLMMNQEGSRR
ncbi:uncharacterized protein G2W53_012346 [Senna tora]|uniref:Uncharacterized protein n=1 Tax=Senna tora TaxID=362788 RepID=A0A834WQK1_9FABA|nr:uncharacterized protein G2W53_012346 [Senna tora]